MHFYSNEYFRHAFFYACRPKLKPTVLTRYKCPAKFNLSRHSYHLNLKSVVSRNTATSSFKIIPGGRREENQLDTTECLISLIIFSKCFGHLYAHHQELETILLLLPHMICNALVAGGRLLGTEQQARRQG